MLFASVFLLFSSVFHANGNPRHITPKLLEELEILGEAYYNKQLDERNTSLIIADEFKILNANFPCIMGTFPVGSADEAGIVDGHKYLCGVHAISGPPIVFSYGCRKDDAFERALLRLRPDAKIYIFELSDDKFPNSKSRDSRIEYIPVGLGGYDNVNGEASSGTVVSSMQNMMRKHKHSYVDILKMDIEGQEFFWFKHEITTLGPRIGQMAIKVHIGDQMIQNHFPKENSITLVTELEKYDLRVFHKELNRQATHCCVELSLIQSKWNSWEQKKSHLIAL